MIWKNERGLHTKRSALEPKNFFQQKLPKVALTLIRAENYDNFLFVLQNNNSLIYSHNLDRQWPDSGAHGCFKWPNIEKITWPFGHADYY